MKAVVTVEDHHPEGGIGEAVRSALPDGAVAGHVPGRAQDPEKRQAGAAPRLRGDIAGGHYQKSEGASMRPQHLKTRIFLDGGKPRGNQGGDRPPRVSRRPDHESDPHLQEPRNPGATSNGAGSFPGTS